MLRSRPKTLLISAALAAIGFAGLYISEEGSYAKSVQEHDNVKRARLSVNAAIAPGADKSALKDAEADLIALGWSILYGGDQSSYDLAVRFNSNAFGAYYGRPNRGKIYETHTQWIHAKLLGLRNFDQSKPVNPSSEYAEITKQRVEKVLSPGPIINDVSLAEGSLSALGWLALYGNDSNSLAVANVMMNAAFTHWRGSNDIYMLHTSIYYSEIINLGRFKLGGNNASTGSGDPIEDQYWAAIQLTGRAQDYEAYLRAYPDGRYISIARAKLGRSATTSSNSPLQKVAFVTAERFTGNLGGVAGADAICRNAAEKAGLDGNFKAWISDRRRSPSTSFTQSKIPYGLPNGTRIASNWEDLVDGSLIANLMMDEFKMPLRNPGIWTGTLENGKRESPDCRGWTSESGSGSHGCSSTKSSGWSSCGTDRCTAKRPLYCFQQ